MRFSRKEEINVSSVGDILNGIGSPCEDKKGSCLIMNLFEIDTIKKMRVTVLKLRIENIINSFNTKCNSRAKKRNLKDC